MRKWLKWIGIILLIPVVLILLISILLYIPPVQNFILQKATRYASEATGMEINVDRIRLSFPLDVTVDGVEVITPPADTLAVVESLSVRVNPLPLLQRIVSVDALHVVNARVNTGSFIEGMEIKGVVGDLSARADHISLTDEKAAVNRISLSESAITVVMDTVSKADTTASAPLNWIVTLDDISFGHICFGLDMPADSLRLSTYISGAGLKDGQVDLGQARYTVNQFTLSETNVNYDGNYDAPAAGLDPMHIALSRLNARIASIVYHEKEIGAEIQEFSVEERSGLIITSMTGNIQSDSTVINVPELLLQTPDSEIRLLATVPWSVLDTVSEGSLQALLTASVGKNDLFTLVNGLPAGFVNGYPDQPLSLTANVEGNLEALALRQLKAELPGALVFNATGTMGELMDSIRRSADIRLQAQTRNVNFALNMLPAEQRQQFNIPRGMRLTGNVGLNNQQLRANLLLTEDKARVNVDARYHMAQEAYQASLAIDSLEPIHFMPNDSIMWVTASLQAEGRGTDFFAASTWVNLTANIDSIRYVDTEVSDIDLTASLRENQANLNLKSNDPVVNMDVTFDGTVRRDEIKGMLIADVDSIDLYALNLIDAPLSTSFQLFGEAESNLQKNHSVDLTIGNWVIRTDSQYYRPKTLTLLARTDEDTTRVSLNTGDLGVALTGNSDLTTMIDKVNVITREINTQLQQDSILDIAALRPSLPDMDLVVTAGNDNPIYNILQQNYIGFRSLRLDASTSPEDGIRMDAHVYSLHRDTFLIDTVLASIRPDSAGLLYRVDVYKNRYRQQLPFTAHVNGTVRNNYVDAELVYINHKDSVGLSMGVSATKEPDAILVRFFPERQIIAFNEFTLNTDNYIRYRDMKNIEANVRFTGQNNASLWIHSVENAGQYPEMHVELSQIDLGRISNGFPQIPDMAGILSADMRYAPNDDAFLVVMDANVDDLYFQNGRIGEIMLNGVYLPLDEGNHQIDVHLTRDRQEAATATAVYRPNDPANNIDGQVNITTLPLSMVSPFIPDSMATLRGTLNSQLLVTGSTSAPVVNGYFQFDSSAVFVNPANSEFTISDDRVEIQNSILTFNNFNIFAANNNPLVLSGNINFSNLSRMMADLSLNADNLQLLDAARTSESLVYGRVLVNLSTTLRGPLNALTVRGDLDLLGGTNVTYVLTDSPLAVRDRLSELVTFTSFADTLLRIRQRQEPLPLGGMDILMVLHIEPVVQLRVDLTPDQSSYAEVVGGGDLSFQYTPQGDMVLNGRYTFNEGVLNYELPVVPLKEFHIAQDSYIQWDGEVMNPLINVEATERMRVSAKTAGETSPRMVYFNVGIQVNDRLEDMEPEFIISAEDSGIENELASMGPEERSKQAVAMMVTGSYLYGGGGGGMNLDVNSALNSFLTSEINNIAGDALKSVDISFGMETYQQEGNTKRDFSFQFARRFYNDRIRVVVGGRVSTGGATQDTEPFLDNVSLEYRLTQSGSTNVKLFHDRNYVSVLEGEITETGAGIIFRKKMRKLRELFDFRRKRPQPVDEEQPTNSEPAGNDEQTSNEEQTTDE